MGLNGAGKSRRARTPLASEGAHMLEIGNPPNQLGRTHSKGHPAFCKMRSGQWAVGSGHWGFKRGPGDAEWASG